MPSQRDRLLAAASRLFQRGGLEAVSIRRVAAAVGVSPMAVYRHFKDKDDLVEALVQLGLTRFETRLRQATGRTPLDRIRALATGYLDFALDEPDTFDLLFLARRPSDDGFLTDYGVGGSPSFALLRVALDQAVAAKDLPPGDSLGRGIQLWGTIHGLVCLWSAGRLGGKETEFRKLVSETVTATLAGFTPGKPSPGRRRGGVSR